MAAAGAFFVIIQLLHMLFMSPQLEGNCNCCNKSFVTGPTLTLVLRTQKQLRELLSFWVLAIAL